MFNLSKKVLAESEIRVLEKGLGFNEFARKMRCKWFFRDESTGNFSEASVFRVRDTLL